MLPARVVPVVLALVLAVACGGTGVPSESLLVGPLLSVQSAGDEDHARLVGVSREGVEGDLALDDLVSYGQALSADGRHVAYWITGATTGPRHRVWQESETGGWAGPDDAATPAGYAVYDAVTGRELLREVLTTPHGIAPESLVWADADTLALSFGRHTDDGDPHDGQEPYPRTELWLRDLEGTGAREASSRRGRENMLVSSNGAGVLVLYGSRPQPSFTLVDQEGSSREILMHPELPGSIVPHLSADGRTVATVEDTRLLVGRIAGDRVTLRPVAGYATLAHAIGWLDPSTLAVSTSWDESSPRVLAVDVRTGSTREVLRTRSSDLAWQLVGSAGR